MSTPTIKSRVDAIRTPRDKPRHIAHVLADTLHASLLHQFETTDDDDMRERIRVVLAASKIVKWPSKKYYDDPLALVSVVLWFQLTDDQSMISRAVKDNLRVAVKSGHNVGKSSVAAMTALWLYYTHLPCRVVLISTTSRQVDDILWGELRALHHRA